MRRSSQRGEGFHQPFTPDELEYIKAVDAFRRRYDVMVPTCREQLAILKALGYRKGGTGAQEAEGARVGPEGPQGPGGQGQDQAAGPGETGEPVLQPGRRRGGRRQDAV